ncbi:MAG: hypothetical protein L0Z62_34545, partial [Gemmataceae bacterium]|nr:hypothetical protein [Gemmataceae bacterium]
MLHLFGDGHCLLLAFSVGEIIEGLFKNTSAAIVIMGDLCYLGLAGVALWGLFSAAMVWLRIQNVRFRNEDAQNKFLKELNDRMSGGSFDSAISYCEDEGGRLAVPQLARL